MISTKYVFVFLPFSIIALLFFTTFAKAQNADVDDEHLEAQFGQLLDRRSHKGPKKTYKCYEGQEREGSKLSECVGRVCFRSIHQQSGEYRMFCKNFTEPGDPEPGKCLDLNNEQMLGQIETMCACIENYCNGASVGNFLSLILLLACLITILLCSSFIGAVMLKR